MRRFGEPVQTPRRYTTRAGAYAVILHGRNVLMTEQADPGPEIQLPGGGIDPGESPLRALHRECLEETGWRIQPIRRLGAFQRFTFMPDYDLWARKVCHIFLARPVRAHGAPSEPGHRALWLPIETAARRAGVEGDRHFLRILAHRLG